MFDGCGSSGGENGCHGTPGATGDPSRPHVWRMVWSIWVYDASDPSQPQPIENGVAIWGLGFNGFGTSRVRMGGCDPLVTLVTFTTPTCIENGVVYMVLEGGNEAALT